MNAGASEWKPSVGASEWSPNNNASDSWEDEPVAPVVAPTPAAAPAAAPAADEGDDGLYMELQQLLADGEITENDFVEALLESGLPVDPAMQERVNKTNAVKKANEQAVAAAATATSAVAVATSAPTNPAPTTTTTKGTKGTKGKGETKTATKAEKAAAKRGGDNKSKVKPIPKNNKKSDHPDPDPRPHANVVFIGHVDAGKSTIAGTVMFLTGNVDKRLIEKYEKEAKERNRDSWYMAYIMDTNDEERAKGKTVEVGMAHFATDVNRFTVLDAPGHANYVPNMIGEFF